MIADIEFRWVKRKIPFDPVNYVAVLQFRKKEFWANTENYPDGLHEWADWQDVPVEEE